MIGASPPFIQSQHRGVSHYSLPPSVYDRQIPFDYPNSDVKCHATSVKTQNKCRWTSTISARMALQCHMPSSMCHVKFVKCQLRYGFFVLTSRTTCHELTCACQLTLFYVCASFWVLNVNKLQYLCPTCIYTATTHVIRPLVNTPSYSRVQTR